MVAISTLPVPSCFEELRGNHIATLSPQHLAERLSPVKQELTEVQSEILQQEQLLTRLRERSQVLQRCIVEHESLEAPIRRLPDEVLCLIFGHVTHSHITPSINWPETSHPFSLEPFTLGLVSKYWYDLITAVPSLWSRFVINLNATVWPANAEMLLQRHLALSKSNWLYVSILETFVANKVTPESNPAHRLKLLLLQSSDRVRSLVISSNGDPFSPYLPVPTLPNLFQLQFDVLDFEPIHESTFSWIPSLPSLRDVYVWHGTSHPGLISALGQCQQTRMLGTTDDSLEEAFQTLKPVRDVLNVVFVEVQTAPTSEPVASETFPALKELYVSFPKSFLAPNRWKDPYPSLLEALTTPSLEVLKLGDSDSEPERKWDRKAFEGFVSRSNISSTLTSLLISSTFISYADTVSMLNLLPAIRMLSLVSSDKALRGLSTVSIAFLHHLTPGKAEYEGSPVLPRLDELHIAARHIDDVLACADAVQDLVVSRLSSPSHETLTFLQILVDESNKEEFERRLAPLRDRKAYGLTINLSLVPGDTRSHDTTHDLVMTVRAEGGVRIRGYR